MLPKPALPAWVFDRPAPETLEEAAFSSGSALALLHVALHDPNINVPIELLRTRLALRAAIHCNRIEGRVVTEAETRDDYLLTVPGDAPDVLRGPNGDMLAFWRTGIAIGLRHRRSPDADWQNRFATALPEDVCDHLSEWLKQSDDLAGNPVSKSAHILMSVLRVFPRYEAVALLCADTVLAGALGWERAIPLMSTKLARKTLRSASDGENILVACHVAVALAAQDTIRLAHDLARRAARLRAIEPKLRNRGAADAVKLFLNEDAILPSSMLSPTIRGSSTLMTPRSARRLCDRLVALGAVRELSGRKTFRLYGVA